LSLSKKKFFKTETAKNKDGLVRATFADWAEVDWETRSYPMPTASSVEIQKKGRLKFA